MVFKNLERVGRVLVFSRKGYGFIKNPKDDKDYFVITKLSIGLIIQKLYQVSLCPLI